MKVLFESRVFTFEQTVFIKLTGMFCFLESFVANTPGSRVFENAFQVSDRPNAVCALGSLSGVIARHEIQNS